MANASGSLPIGGFHKPSETLLLRWSDVDWGEEKILVRSPKTEHHEGKSERIIHLFPELRAELTKQKKSASKDAVFVIDRWRDTDRNLRKYFERIIFQAGLEQWPRLFHLLRESRSNELFSKFPAHVAGNWMGQGDRIACNHYLHLCDNDFAKAVASDEGPTVPPEELPEEISEDNPSETALTPPAKNAAKRTNSNLVTFKSASSPFGKGAVFRFLTKSFFGPRGYPKLPCLPA